VRHICGSRVNRSGLLRGQPRTAGRTESTQTVLLLFLVTTKLLKVQYERPFSRGRVLIGKGLFVWKNKSKSSDHPL
jgi:hypothetical protein